MDSATWPERFIVKGPAKSALHTLAKYRALLAPLRFGAGESSWALRDNGNC
jgi:hypothetical protein